MSGNLKSIKMALIGAFLFMVGSISAQTVKVTVTDETGEPVIGASVLEKGSQNGGITDIDGIFNITLKGSKQIVVSYIGMKTQTIDGKGKTAVDVVLKDDATGLEEVVVIGYGSVRKKDITGSVATVNSETLQAVPVANASEALTGKLAGVQVTTTEGSPDAEVKIRVRGGGSITQSNDPLYIVDGFPVDGISDIPANDIEDITVLKDASSTAIYGSRGANGVILVTTKSGQAGKVKVSYNAYYSWKKIAKKYDVLDVYDYAKWQYEYAMLYNGGDATKINHYTDKFGNYQDMDLYKSIEGNDWQDLAYGRTGHTFNHNININGGSDNMKYAFSYAHMNDKAIMIGSSFKRDNFSLKLNTKPTKKTTLDFQARYANTSIFGGGANEAAGAYDTDRRLRYAVLYTPLPMKGIDGTDDLEQASFYDPITTANDNDQKKQRRNLNLAGSFGWEVYKNLKLKTEFGYDTYDEYAQRFWGTTSYYIKNVPTGTNQGKPAIRNVDTKRHRFRNTNTVSYDFKALFGKDSDHSLNVLVGHEYVITKKHAITNEVHGFPTDYDAETAWKLTSQGTPYTVEDFYSADDKLLSWFGRANYNYKDKYLISATFRADGSSKFAEKNRWGYFPSAAIAWRVSAEPFMEGTKDWLTDLKLRFSYGTAGNNNIPVGQLVQEYQNKATTWVNGFPNYWAPSKTMFNPDLKWETTITRNVGIDFTLWNGKLNGSLEGYINTTKDLLIQFPTGGTGYDNQYRNLGKTQNMGAEFSFTYHIVNKADWGIDFNGNIGYNKNEIKELGMNDFATNTNWGSTEIGNDYRVAVGHSVGEIIGYKNAGRYEVSDFSGYNETTGEWILKEGVVNSSSVIGTIRPGSMKLKDVSGPDGTPDGVITDADIVDIGNVNPTFVGGFGLNARAYGFDLSANFNFSMGNKVYNANKIEYTTASYTKFSQYRNLSTEMADGKRWTYVNAAGQFVTDPAELAALNANTTMWSPYMQHFVLTDWAIEKADFLRLNTLTLGYTLPAKIVKRAGITNLRFYVTAYNVFTITGYSGSDPEADCIRKSNLTPSVDYSGYPRSRQLVVGLNLNF
ncbi:MAG: TonB-dependent receptor [Prevotella sp.]|nr:TonB-dependent receptor [Prevotella sp.]